MLVVGVAVFAARLVGLPRTMINLGIGVSFIVSGLIVLQGRRMQARGEKLGTSLVHWGFWLFSLTAGAFVAHNALGPPPS